MISVSKSTLRNTLLVSLLALSAGAVTWGILPSGSSAKTKEADKTLRVKHVKSGKAAQSKKVTRTAKRVAGGETTKAFKASGVKEPDFTLAAMEDAQLSDEYRQLLIKLQDILNHDDRKGVIRFAQDILARIQRGQDVPLFVREQVVRALASCGSDGIPELAGFLADVNEMIVQEAANAFEEMLIDADGDAELATILMSILPAVNDQNMLEGFMSELGNMRNSRRVDTVKKILNTGNEAAIKVLNENLSSYFGDDESGFKVNVVEDLDEYLARNPDGEDDETFYGKWQNGDDEGGDE